MRFDPLPALLVQPNASMSDASCERRERHGGHRLTFRIHGHESVDVATPAPRGWPVRLVRSRRGRWQCTTGGTMSARSAHGASRVSRVGQSVRRTDANELLSDGTASQSGLAEDFAGRTPVIARGAVPQLAGGVAPPAKQYAVACESTGVVPARAQRIERKATIHGKRDRAPSDRVRVAPAVRDTFGREPAGVFRSRADRGEREPSDDGNRARLLGGFTCPVAELAKVVGAPAIGLA